MYEHTDLCHYGPTGANPAVVPRDQSLHSVDRLVTCVVPVVVGVR